MGLIQTGVHFSLRQLTRKSHAQFLAERKNLGRVQFAIFQRLLAQSARTRWGVEHGFVAGMSYETFCARVPPTSWDDWAPWVEREKQERGSLAQDVTRFQPTSGSTHQRKWIPYTRSYLGEIDRATGPWIHDMYLCHPGVRRGRHYWSLSWLPDDLRQQMSNNDLSYFPWAKRLFLAQAMAVSDDVQRAESSARARELTIQQLIECRDLSLISVWSPSFLTGLCQDLWQQRDHFARSASAPTRQILRAATSLEECVQQLWPALALVSCWQTVDARPWAERAQALMPKVQFQGKGLFATEGVVTIPVAGSMQLAYQSHFYEFERDSGEIVRAEHLRPGDEVRVLLSTGSGLWRYRLGDRVAVEALASGCPVLTFLGRDHTVDLVGEKLSFDAARGVLKKLGPHALLFLASPGDAAAPAGYVLLVEGAGAGALAASAEALLCEYHHYRLARELGQLAPVRVHACTTSSEFFPQLAQRMGWVLGDVKWEALMKLPKPWEAPTWNA